MKDSKDIIDIQEQLEEFLRSYGFNNEKSWSLIILTMYRYLSSNENKRDDVVDDVRKKVHALLRESQEKNVTLWEFLQAVFLEVESLVNNVT